MTTTTQTQVKLRQYNLALGKSCLSGYVLRRVLGSGTYGIVHAACDLKKQCIYAVKIQVLPTKFERTEFKVEVHFTKLASTHKYGPTLYGARICLGLCQGKACRLLGSEVQQLDTPIPSAKTRLGIVVMERYPHAYHDLRSHTVRPYLTLMRTLIKAHRAGVIHSDLLAKNIVVSADKTDVKLIDWGLSFAYNVAADSLYSFQTRRKAFKNWYNTAMVSYLMPNFTIFYAQKAYDVIYAIIQWGLLLGFDYRPLLRAPPDKTQTMREYADAYLKEPAKVSHLLVIDWAFAYTEWLAFGGKCFLVRVLPETTGVPKTTTVPIFAPGHATVAQLRKSLHRWLKAFKQWKRPVQKLTYKGVVLADQMILRSIPYASGTFIEEENPIKPVAMTL